MYRTSPDLTTQTLDVSALPFEELSRIAATCLAKIRRGTNTAASDDLKRAVDLEKWRRWHLGILD